VSSRTASWETAGGDDVLGVMCHPDQHHGKPLLEMTRVESIIQNGIIEDADLCHQLQIVKREATT
jgi:hypothetical protein